MSRYFRKSFFFSPIFLSLCCWGWMMGELQAQEVADTTLLIPTVEISASKIRYQTIGGPSQEWTSEQLEKRPATQVAELLANETGTYIKSYGLGSLATSSVRGGSAGHTLVLWNGLPIQSPMLGQLDLSLLPLQAVESVGFTRGGNAALWGSGAIGGTLNLDNQADFSRGLQVDSRTQLGSFGQFQQQLKLGIGNQKIQSITRLSHQQADNDYHYFLAEGLPERQQTNARLSQQYLLQDLYWKMDKRRQLALHFWQQQSDRQIPPTNVQTLSEAHQDDLATRIILDFQQVEDRSIWKLKAGFFNEQLNYFDDRILLESRSRFRTYLAELTGQWHITGGHQLLVGNTHTRTRAWSAGYQENTPAEYRTALFASWKYHSKRFQSQLSLRQEMVDGDLVPIVPALGLQFKVNPNWSLQGKISRNYRLPTFNDRFWLPGGNPDLLPESGWSQELTLDHQATQGPLQLSTALTAFNRNIDNWILWSIQDGQSFWSANNITKVWSRGLEFRFNLIYQLKALQFQLQGGYDYVRSTNQVELESPKIAAGEQLIYTPIHQAFSTFSIEWKSLHIAYQHSFTGATMGVNDPLDAYYIGNARLQYSGSMGKYRGSVFFNLNNIWDRDYLVIERRPMPGIHFQTGIQIFFNSTP